MIKGKNYKLIQETKDGISYGVIVKDDDSSQIVEQPKKNKKANYGLNFPPTKASKEEVEAVIEYAKNKAADDEKQSKPLSGKEIKNLLDRGRELQDLLEPRLKAMTNITAEDLKQIIK